MTSELRLAAIVQALRSAGVDVLVMGGHAVRYYGITRNTVDFDLVTVATAEQLRQAVAMTGSIGMVREIPVWRRNDFARFEMGRLPDGREERRIA